ncbi:MAG TPA: M48 family metalloprotease [Albitalea sp.]
MNTPTVVLAAAAAAGVLLAAPAHAQFGGLIDKLIPGATNAASAVLGGGTTRPADAPARDDVGAGATASARAASAGASGKTAVVGDLPPDRQCKRPQEKFNVVEKAVEYGGQEAAMRLETIVKSNYRYADLTPQDRAMLKYLAQTTVWVPVEAERLLAGAYEKVRSVRSGPANEGDELMRQRIAERLEVLKAPLSDFPVAIRLVIDPDLADGAWARFGGVIQIAPSFAETMAEHPMGGDLVLAHELSHVYKRHPLKKLQFELLSSQEGWELGQKVLQRAMRGMASDPIGDGVFLATTMPRLITFVRSLQLKFSREQELEADACAVNWLRAAKEDPVRAWDQFAAKFTSTSSYGGTHPPTAERASNYKAKLSLGSEPDAPAPRTKAAKTARTAPPRPAKE